MTISVATRMMFLGFPLYRLIFRGSKKHLRATRKILAEVCEGGIGDGPFKGMYYGSKSVNSQLGPKLVGIYELELHETINKLLKEGFDETVVVGAAEGYYAVGMAAYSGCKKNIAFETSEAGQKLVWELAKLNSVDEILDVRGECDSGSLRAVLEDAQNPLVIMDVEGAEEHLLDPEKTPGLKVSTILVELHDKFIDGLIELLRNRFSSSHSIEEIVSVPRSIDDLPMGVRKEMGWLPDELVELALVERDYLQRWWLMRPKL